MNNWKKQGFVIVFLLLIILCMGMNFAMESKVPDLQDRKDSLSMIEKDPVIVTEQRQLLTKEETQEAVKDTADKEKEHKFWHATSVEIDKSYSTAYVVVQYTNVKNTPMEALIYTPDCSQFYSNIAMNEGMAGEIIFELKNPQKGTWQILLLEEINLGTYVPYVIDKAEYEARKMGQDEERIIPY